MLYKAAGLFGALLLTWVLIAELQWWAVLLVGLFLAGLSLLLGDWIED